MIPIGLLFCLSLITTFYHNCESFQELSSLPPSPCPSRSPALYTQTQHHEGSASACNDPPHSLRVPAIDGVHTLVQQITLRQPGQQMSADAELQV